jgi:uncharacterized protein (DUF2235 family)
VDHSLVLTVELEAVHRQALQANLVAVRQPVSTVKLEVARHQDPAASREAAVSTVKLEPDHLQEANLAAARQQVATTNQVSNTQDTKGTRDTKVTKVTKATKATKTTTHTTTTTTTSSETDTRDTRGPRATRANKVARANKVRLQHQ